MSEKNPRVWWINQGASLAAYANDREYKYIWARKFTDGKRPVTLKTWSCLTEMQPGDVTLHYVRGQIVDIGKVIAASEEGPRPINDLKCGDRPGWKVSVQYFELKPPIGRYDLPTEWCTKEAGPFCSTGRVKYGFAFSVSTEFARELRDLFPSRWPVDSPWGLEND